MSESDSEEYGGDLRREKAYQDEELMRELYVEKEMSIAQVAEEVGCAETTARNWLKRLGIGTRSISEAVSLGYGNRPNEVPLQTKQTGAVRWNYSGKGEKRTVFVHRLLAVAIWGFEAVKENVVHHRNEIRWDNRPANLELMGHSDHSSHHKKLNYLDRLRIVEMYRDGASSYKIAPTFSVTPSAIIDAVRDFDPEMVRGHGPVRGGAA